MAAAIAAQQLFQPMPERGDKLDTYTSLGLSILSSLGLAAVVIGAYTLFVRLTERRWPRELTLERAPGELATGALLGLSLTAMSVGLIWLAGSYQIDGVAPRALWPSLVVRALAIAIVSSVVEELIMRGVVLRILAEGVGRWWALAVSSLVFGALHIANPNSSVTDGMILVIEAGLLLGAAFLWTERLWLPIGLHGGWNFALAAIFGGPLSGQDVSSIVSARLVGPARISGGPFGIEGSLVTTIVCVAAGCTILGAVVRRDRRIVFDERSTILAANAPAEDRDLPPSPTSA